MTEEMNPGEVLDPAALENLREMVGGDAEFLAELIDAFFAEAPQLLSNMRRAVEDGNAEGLRQAAHSLKPNSADFGSPTLTELCRQLEMLGKAGTLDGVVALVTQAEAEYKKMKTALEAMRRGERK